MMFPEKNRRKDEPEEVRACGSKAERRREVEPEALPELSSDGCDGHGDWLVVGVRGRGRVG